ncbi:probable RNA polymerase II nuclear localization protein SLC7A6OS [Lucilia cuprina]|uniref:probable RNA polymerase II nuclear localization protein SLC7A6OS n=1 Tax=Lucilia cuprina TaxID=7375 RepID=UPI001F069F55|nr:probable RNA polymerase II nuclear localization protein SLC7A6OS [Lucilia cuprina]
MPAVVRVKRRIDEEPLSAFVLNGKRRRLEEETGASGGALNNKEELSTLLKFAGTIKEQDDTATTQYARLSKEQAKELVLQKSHKSSNFNEKLRQEVRQQQQEQRFRVVNCLRTTLEGDKNEASASADKKTNEITIVDIEKHNATTTPNADDNKTVTKSTTNEHLLEASTSAAAAATSAAAAALTMPTDSDTGYVYDLYIPDNEQQADYVDLMDDNYLSVRAFDDLIYEDRYNNEDDEEYDSEDSNQENYFANEYPDEDDDAAMNSDREIDIDDIDEDESTKHLRKGLEQFVFSDDDEENDVEGFNDSSSDDGGFYNAYRDPYVHSIDPEEEGFCNDVDSCDVDRYGLAYARYKARILKKTKAKKGEDDDDEDELENDDEAEFYKTGTDEEDDYYHSANESDEDEYY